MAPESKNLSDAELLAAGMELDELGALNEARLLAGFHAMDIWVHWIPEHIYNDGEPGFIYGLASRGAVDFPKWRGKLEYVVDALPRAWPPELGEFSIETS